MRIAFDLHGVITLEPEHYKKHMSLLCKINDTIVFVISGPQAINVEKELNELGFYRGTHFHHIGSVIDYLISKGNIPTIDEYGNYWFEEKIWWESKSLICRELKIDILEDDHQEYGSYFINGHPTKFILKHHAYNS